MANLLLELKLNPISVCNSKQPPLCCNTGDQIILFLTDPAKTLNGTGVIVAEILTRTFDKATCKWCYTVQYDDAVLAVGTTEITQCDIETQCCYDCIARYADSLSLGLNCSAILGCLSGFELAANNGANETVDQGDTLSILGDNPIDTIVSASDNVNIALLLSADAGNALEVRGDGLYLKQQVFDTTEAEIVRTASGADISGLGTLTLANLFINPAIPTYSDIEIHGIQNGYIEITVTADWEGDLRLQRDIDGGGWLTMWEEHIGPFSVDTSIVIPITNSFILAGTPPAVSVTIDARMQLETTAAASGAATLDFYRHKISAAFGTV